MTATASAALDLAKLGSPVLFTGNASAAYRDPAAYYHTGEFHLYFSYSSIAADGLAACRA